jgi:hypothetical protein
LKKLFLFFLLIASAGISFGQNFPNREIRRPEGGAVNSKPSTRNNGNVSENIDSLRAKLEAKKDSIIYNSKYIKFTKEEFLRDSTRIFPIDTTTTNFHRYRVLDLPEHPTMNLGLNGLSYRNMLFEPSKTIGFDVGNHYYDRYLLNPEDVIYYQARTPYTEFYLENPAFGRLTEQMFHVIHSQNVKPNWNIGASFAKTGSRSYYGAPGRRADALAVNHLNASLWSWYNSKNKRYTLLANGTFNNLKGYENGSILNDSIFTKPTNVLPEYEESRLSTAKHNMRNNSLYIKQFYNIGKQKSIDSNAVVLPTQRISYKLLYNTQKYFFVDETGYVGGDLLKNYYIYQDSSKTSDSTQISHLQNEFTWQKSFFFKKRVKS